MTYRAVKKEDVVAKLSEKKGEIIKFGVKKIGVFGSFVRQDQNHESDVDILIEFDKKMKSYSNFIGVTFLLEDSLGRKVDVVTEEALSPYIKPYVLKEVEYVSIGS